MSMFSRYFFGICGTIVHLSFSGPEDIHSLVALPPEVAEELVTTTGVNKRPAGPEILIYDDTHMI
jgi:hypothetical protein